MPRPEPSPEPESDVVGIPGIGLGGSIAEQVPAQGLAFEGLLVQLRAEHQRLWSLTGTLAAENEDLRRRLESGEGSEPLQRLVELEPSFWRVRQLPSKTPTTGTAATAGVTPILSEVTAPSLESIQGQADGLPEKVSEEGSYDEETQRVEACIQKLQVMLEIPETKRSVHTDQFESFLVRLGRDHVEAISLVEELFARLQLSGERRSTKFVPKAMMFELTKSWHRHVGNHDVSLQSIAELLLFGNEEEVLAPCSHQMKELVEMVRTHAFHQDSAGIIATRTSINDWERTRRKERFDKLLDSTMNVVIMANAVCMGIFATPEPTWGVWDAGQVMDAVFTGIFLAEALVKLRRSGPRSYFCGPEAKWHIFDVAIVVMGLLDFLIAATASADDINTSSLMVFKLLRLTRLIRVIRTVVFRELKLLINGFSGLLKTLSCVLVVLLVATYTLATVMVPLFGGERGRFVEGHDKLFSTLPRSMFTVFRCLNIGDCTAEDGTPIALHMSEQLGWPFILVHCVLSVLMQYGLGSLITGLVVDTTLNEAKKAEMKAARNQIRRLEVSAELHRLGQMLITAQRLSAPQHSKLSQVQGQSQDMLFVGRRTFISVTERAEAQTILANLDIEGAESEDLFDVLDADGNGFIEIDELVGGLLKMSGEARRADAVAVRLKINSVVRKLNSTQTTLMEGQAKLLDNQEHLLVRMNMLFGEPTKAMPTRATTPCRLPM